MEVTGILKEIYDTQIVSDKFKKREFVLTTDFNTQYPQHCAMQFTQDKCNALDQYAVGEEVKIQFNLRGREWNGPQGVKYFNTLEAWRIEKVGGSTQQQPQQQQQTQATGNAFSNSSISDNDDLPF